MALCGENAPGKVRARQCEPIGVRAVVIGILTASVVEKLRSRGTGVKHGENRRCHL